MPGPSHERTQCGNRALHVNTHTHTKEMGPNDAQRTHVSVAAPVTTWLDGSSFFQVCILHVVPTISEEETEVRGASIVL